jgi:hypothetical protein
MREAIIALQEENAQLRTTVAGVREALGAIEPGDTIYALERKVRGVLDHAEKDRRR